MFQEERMYKIMEMLMERQSLTTNDIVTEFGVSRDTARRDIVKLTENGSVIRTHGGITLQGDKKLNKFYDLRLNDLVEEKQRIGKKAAELIEPGQVCYFDSSTSVLQMCRFVPSGIEAFSNSLNNVQALDARRCNVHVLGGKLNHNNKYIYGYETVEQILNTKYDIAFLGTDAIDETGLYSFEQEDSGLKKAVASMADKIYVLTEASKFNVSRPYKCFPINKVDMIITDRIPDNNKAEAIEKCGVKVIIA